MKCFLLFATLFLGTYTMVAQDAQPKIKHMSLSELKAASGIKSILPNFDFDATCNVESYVVIIQQRREDPIQINVKGSDFPSSLKQTFKTLEAGAIVNIMNIKSRCTNDAVARDIGGLNFLVK
jgi:GldM C-terminal domain